MCILRLRFPGQQGLWVTQLIRSAYESEKLPASVGGHEYRVVLILRSLKDASPLLHDCTIRGLRRLVALGCGVRIDSAEPKCDVAQNRRYHCRLTCPR